MPPPPPVAATDHHPFRTGDYGAFTVWSAGTELRVVLLARADVFAGLLAERRSIERELGHALLWDEAGAWVGVRRVAPEHGSTGQRADAAAWATWMAERLVAALEPRAAGLAG
jgi:hypothetical protein